MSEKLKVVWLCHLSNKEIQDILKPWKKSAEFAPWMFMSLKIAENDPRFEIHVVSPHAYIRQTKSFVLRGIYYHFYNPYIPLWGRPLPRVINFNEWIGYKWAQKEVGKIISEVKPDVIHLYGAENPYYSSAILPLRDKYPTILTVQGFISHTKDYIDRHVKYRIQIEREVIKSIPVCFFRSKIQARDTLEINPSMELMPNFFGSYELKYENLPTEKKYDLVFFARVCKDKGIEDLLNAVKIIKQTKPNITLCVIGGGEVTKYKNYCKSLGIEQNVFWSGFLPTRKDVHFKVAECRISVLPTYHDVLPGTIIESMFLGVPVVTYNVDSNPEINENFEAIKLVHVGDVQELTNTLLNLLKDEAQRLSLSKSGLKRAYEMFAPADETVANQWYAGYQRAIHIKQFGCKTMSVNN